VLIPFVPWIIDRLGVRASITMSSVFIGIGSALRAATLHHELAPSALYLAHSAAFFNALAGILR
jgi:cyanate permease